MTVLNTPGSTMEQRSKPSLGPLLKRINHLRCKAWDIRHSVDTCGEIPLTSLAFQNPNKSTGLEYQSHHPKITRDALHAPDVPYEQYNFIDYGCGKGRVLLVASEFPFRKIVGLEFAPSLAETAQRNLETYRGRNVKCRNIEVLVIDATTYDLPPEPAVLYFFSPFAGSVMDKVIRNIERSVEKYPRRLLVVFSGIFVMRDKAFGSRPTYRRLLRQPYFDLYQRVL